MKKLALIFLLISFQSFAQDAINPVLLTKPWPSRWINCPAALQKNYGVFDFRKTFNLAQKPARYLIHLSADNHYRLWINNSPLTIGPSASDLYHWYYDTIDIAPYLTAGKNTIAVEVWNMGEYKAANQVSAMTALVVQGDRDTSVNTNNSWKVLHDTSYTACSTNNSDRLGVYMVVNPGDRVDGKAYPWGWQSPAYDDSRWQQAQVIGTPTPFGTGTGNTWNLVPRIIPQMQQNKQLVAGSVHHLTVPAHQHFKMLLDHKTYTVAYPELTVSGGSGAQVKLTYAEALFDAAGNKGNRNDTAGKTIQGNYDIFIADGGERRLFRPLNFRAFRFLQLDITTGDEPLTIDSLFAIKTGYPLHLNATFSSNDKSLDSIWRVGWRTAQSCAGETYYDSPYYEQLQYTGDTRIQALISLYDSGDDRLMRKAILDFYYSRTPEGLTQSRYPGNTLQIIPPFSLFWVSMVYDYWMHRKDDAFVRQFLPQIREILGWYARHTDQRKHMLGPMPWWNFTDWDNFGDWGIAPGADEGNSAIISLQYAYTLNQASALFAAYGEPNNYPSTAKQIAGATYKLCFNTKRLEMANTPQQDSFSQHVGIWAILSGAIPRPQQKAVIRKLLTDTGIGQVTFFYRFYLVQALQKAGLADLYYRQLGPWRKMISLGLTTFAEKPGPTRSDCHAWSASPNYDFLATICGIMPAAPGFGKVLVKPAMGELTEVEGELAWPKVKVHLVRTGKHIHAEIILPGGLSGTFVWRSKSVYLHSGIQSLHL